MTGLFDGAQAVRFARHAGMESDYGVQPLPPERVAEWVAGRTKREREILGYLLAAQEHHGRLVMLSPGTLRASAQTMSDLFYAGLVNGCGSDDHRGTGNTWSVISHWLRFLAGWQCEWCGADNGNPHPDTGSRVPQSSWWWLTERGEQIARAGGLAPKARAA